MSKNIPIFFFIQHLLINVHKILNINTNKSDGYLAGRRLPQGSKIRAKNFSTSNEGSQKNG